MSDVFVGVKGELKRRELMRSYPAFVEFANEGFCMTHFHKYVTEQVQEFMSAKTENAFDILLLSVPPRHGKTYMLTETLPAWFLGNNPRGEVILCSYQSTFAEGFSKSCRDKFNRLAPLIWHVGPDKNLQRAELWATEKGGKCRAAGLDAGITGFGAELFIIDDPIKNAAEASSEVIIKKILAEMGPSVQSRIYPHGKLIVIQTRWVENDVVGFIKDNWSEFIWKDINLPCEYDEVAANEGPDPLGRKLGDSLMGPHLGDPLLPQKICNDNEWLKSKKMVVRAAEGERVWNSLYQGRPTGATGNLFDATTFRQFHRTDFVLERDIPHISPQEIKARKKFEYLQLSIDATFKGTEENDFVAMGLRGIYEGDIYLYHQVNKRLTFTETLEKIKWFAEEFPEIDEMVIEDKANGPAIADTLRYIPSIPPVVSVNPMGGKVSRASAISPFVTAGHYYIADDLPAEDVDWYMQTTLSPRDKVITQFRSFPYGKHDDMVDECSQGVIRLIKLITGETPKAERRFIRYTHWYPDMWEDFEQMSAEAQAKFIQTYGAPEEWRE
jgi:predicted phage terminase large subunit-like protein